MTSEHLNLLPAGPTTIPKSLAPKTGARIAEAIGAEAMGSLPGLPTTEMSGDAVTPISQLVDQPEQDETPNLTNLSTEEREIMAGYSNPSSNANTSPKTA